LFAERLGKAKDCLERAWKSDPSLPEPAVLMLTVCVGLGIERDEMETWFRRAMQADPDSFDACSAKLNYLLPKWHGSLEATLGFADQCLRTKNWHSCIPLIEVFGMKELYRCYSPDAFGHSWKHPLLWSRIQAAFEGMLAAYPEDRAMHSHYALLCYQADKWKLAHPHFEKLGSKPWAEYFPSKSDYESMAQDARNAAKRP
jgi:hypothetical protein